MPRADEHTLLLRAIAAMTAAALVVVVCILFALWGGGRRTRPASTGGGGAAAGTCNASTCGATDPVSDPDYNMREIAKQSILLEEHLTVPQKYCVDCVAKHLLHCIALANEAVMLACDRVGAFPYLAEAPAFFQTMMDEWLAASRSSEGPEARLRMAAELRDFRKKLVSAYFTNPAQ
jgi:hypothetical protein